MSSYGLVFPISPYLLIPMFFIPDVAIEVILHPERTGSSQKLVRLFGTVSLASLAWRERTGAGLIQA